jgi:hypothetical protein
MASDSTIREVHRFLGWRARLVAERSHGRNLAASGQVDFRMAVNASEVHEVDLNKL